MMSQQNLFKKQSLKKKLNQQLNRTTKSKAKTKAKIQLTKEPVEVIIEELEPVVEDRPKKVDKDKQMVQCPDCNLLMTQHTLKYIHKQRGHCKRVQESKAEEEVKINPPREQTSVLAQPTKSTNNIAEEIVNNHIKENPEIVTNCLRNERVMKSQSNKLVL